jgi:hypothetical protein
MEQLTIKELSGRLKKEYYQIYWAIKDAGLVAVNAPKKRNRTYNLVDVQNLFTNAN